MQFGGDGTDTSGERSEAESSLPAALSDFELSPGELVDVITHCGRDLFGYLVPGRPPDHPARSKLAEQRATRTTAHRREVDAWNAANPPPF